MTHRLALPHLSALLLALAVTLATATLARAETFTEEMAACVEEALDHHDACVVEGNWIHSSSIRRAWHNARCKTSFVANAAACVPSGMLRWVASLR